MAAGAVTEGTPRLRVHAVVGSGWPGRALGVLSGGQEGEGGSRRGGTVSVGEREVGYRLVEAGETAAVVTEAGSLDGREGLLLHARVVEALLGLRSVVPVPGRLVARDEPAVRRLLERARVPLREALDHFENCYEVRVHVGRREPTSGDRTPAPSAAAEELIRSLRPRWRSARRLRAADDPVAAVAFLVSREEWIAFVQEASGAGDRHPGLDVDVTGPWAPWDFVRFVAEGPPSAGSRGR